MTVSSSVNKVIGDGNGVTTSWPFSFKVFDVTHLVVTYTDANGDETTLDPSAYTPALNTDQAGSPGGTVAYSPAIATGTKVTILRMVPYTQATDIKNQGGFFPEVLERAFDLAVMEIQQLKEEVARAIKLSPSQAAIGDLQSTDDARASMLLGFDADGNPAILSGGADSPVSSVMQPVVASASLAAARTAMGVPSLAGGNTIAGTQNFSDAVNFAGATSLGASAIATTPTAGDNDTSVATTAFVQAAIATLLSVSDAAAAPAATVRQVLYATLTASRIVTLPLAAAVRGGTIIEIKDGSGSAAQGVSISIARAGSDTIDGSASTQVCINVPRGSCYVMSDGVAGWHVLKWSVIYTAVASGDVALANTATWYTGVSVAQGALGTWEVAGGLTMGATDATQAFNGRLSPTDASVIIASGRMSSREINEYVTMHFSGRIAAPAADLAVQGNSPSTSSANIKFNASGMSADIFIKAVRVA